MKQEEPRFANPTATCYSRAPQRKDEAGRCKEQFEHRSCPGQHVVGVCSHISCEDTQQAIADSFFLNRVKDAAGVEAETAVGRRVQKLVLRPHETMLGLSTFFFVRATSRSLCSSRVLSVSSTLHSASAVLGDVLVDRVEASQSHGKFCGCEL